MDGYRRRHGGRRVEAGAPPPDLYSGIGASVQRSVVDPRFAATLRQLRADRGLSLRDLARRAVYGKSYLHELETGSKQPSMEVAERLDVALQAGGQLTGLVHAAGESPRIDDGEVEALELARRVATSDVSAETLDRLELAADELAVAYARVPAIELRPRVQQHLAYIGQLIDTRATLAQRRRLMVVGGWLALVGATVDIDLRRDAAGRAWLTTARQLAEHAEHAEIQAWCRETEAWSLLGDGNYRRAVKLSQEAQRLAPRGSSALIQAMAQEGRAVARLGDAAGTRRVLGRLDKLVSPLSRPDRPEHHYRYDPGKALWYTATTLAWVGDPAAVDFARAVVTQMEKPADGPPRLRRAALARVDLALALLRVGQPDEAAATAEVAIAAGTLVPSNYWRAAEVVAGVERAGVERAARLREAFEAHRPTAIVGSACPRTAVDS